MQSKPRLRAPSIPAEETGAPPDYSNHQSIIPTANLPRHPATLALPRSSGSAKQVASPPPPSPTPDASSFPSHSQSTSLSPQSSLSSPPLLQPSLTISLLEHCRSQMKQSSLFSSVARPPFTLSAVPRLAPKLRAPATTPHTQRAGRSRVPSAARTHPGSTPHNGAQNW